MAIDPVCGMDVSEEGAKFMIHIEHETFYFCSEKCKETYGRKFGLIKPKSPKGFPD